MIPLMILIFGLLLVYVLAAVLLVVSGMTPLVVWLMPAVAMLVMMGSGALALIELLLFLGGKDDRNRAKRDLSLLVPTCALSGVFWYVSAFALGLWR